ncbi:hypothetical protein H6P81_015722 [Aristolochia fimbriata]|uniref:Protein kinase domain-containing protein n=1 Tax=Aristolochia fimbriata TaxID=158543 RepID=A0AAV7E6F9_ARIFI|nr:hypothetical protein H6P81_015722 [Aristolochia fimbriata]
MNLCDRICNQTTVYYSEGRYNRHWTSPNVRSPKKQKRGKESTKEWVARTFYTEPTTASADRISGCAASHRRPSAVTDANGGNSANPVDHSGNSYHGKPAVFFRQSVIESQAEQLKFCLVGKFPGWRPSLSQIRAWVAAKWKLKGEWSITLLDHRHVFIRLDNEADMLHVWPRNRWFVVGRMMRVFKWFPTFVPYNGEPSSAAVWVSLPSLPVAFFQEELLFPIASLAGRVIGMDDPTRNLSRTNVARVCVEVDLLKEPPRQVWVGVGEGGFWQDMCYPRLPSFCRNCREQGHSTKVCQGKRNVNSLLRTSGTTNPSICKDGCPEESLNRSNKIGISLTVEGEDGRGPYSNRQDRCQSGKKKGKVIVECEMKGSSDDHLLSGYSFDEAQKREGIEGTGECSRATAADPTLSAKKSKGTAYKEIYGSGKSGLLETEGESVCIGGEGLKVGFGRISEDKRANTLVSEKTVIPSKRRKFSSKSLMLLWRSKRKELIPEALALEHSHLQKFKFSEIKKMSDSFQDIIGMGGFGRVFRGKLPSGQEVAVKICKNLAYNPELDQFLKELQVLSRTSHTNIIRLLGFCSEGSKRILVYEFMPKDSLAGIIHPKESSSNYAIQGKELCEIAVGVARGLDYLHSHFDPPILHLDIKPSNILLDKNLCPKVSDFGVAHVSPDTEKSRICGTSSYLAPEYAMFGRVSTATDVYSYGIMLLEMALKRRACLYEENIDDMYINKWTRRRVTPTGEIQGISLTETRRKMIIVGIWCAQEDPALRPSFASVIHMLQASIDDLSLPPELPSSMEENAGDGSECTTVGSISDASVAGR